MARSIALAVFAATACVVAGDSARALPPADRDWELQLSFYTWAASLHADVEAGDVQTEIDQGFFDILQDLRWAVMGGAEARYQRGVLLLDTIGMQLVTDVHGGPKKLRFEREFPRREIEGELTVGEHDVHTRLTQWIVDVKPGFRVLSLPMAKLTGAPESPDDWRRFDVDLLAGFRYWNVTNKTNLEIDPAELRVNGNRVRVPDLRGRLELDDVGIPGRPLRNGADSNDTETVDWVDPIVGLRLGADVTERWSVFLLGDVGGWSIANASDLTWQGMIGSHFQITDHWGVSGGFRALGVKRDPALDDAILWGPQIGAVFRF
jgi:hypothetical protein